MENSFPEEWEAWGWFIDPVVIITVGNGKRNGMTGSDVSTVEGSHKPPLVMVSICERNYTHDLIREYKEFAINTISTDQIEVANFFGSRSGRDVDKFKESGVEVLPASKIKAPLLKESPVCLECKVVAEYSSRYHCAELIPEPDGSVAHHTMFIAEVVAIHKNSDKTPIATFRGKYVEIKGREKLTWLERVIFQGKYTEMRGKG
jgi:flavin reductase (DIM6/NTAB) family NADH-FMN oxidoreductase RutF